MTFGGQFPKEKNGIHVLKYVLDIMPVADLTMVKSTIYPHSCLDIIPVADPTVVKSTLYSHSILALNMTASHGMPCLKRRKHFSNSLTLLKESYTLCSEGKMGL
jgi:hypothetical protein